MTTLLMVVLLLGLYLGFACLVGRALRGSPVLVVVEARTPQPSTLPRA